jgi:hypothetical protein
MQALRELFTSDVGLMSLGVIAITVGMGVFYARYFLSHLREDTARAQATSSSTR